MFRAISKHLLRTNNVIQIRKKGIIPDLPKRPKELNNVQLMGTIEHEVKQFRHGPIKLYLKTRNDDTTYCVHNVAIANGSLLAKVKDKLSVGRRIYVAGRLKTENIVIENKPHQNIEIMANELYFLESNPTMNDNNIQNEMLPIQMDENSVEMLAYIGSEVIHTHNLSAFSLASHFVRNKGKPDQSEGKEYHRVVIHKNPNIEAVAWDLNKFDRVYVTGHINYLTKTYPDGKEYTNGFIQPTNMVKLKMFDWIE